MFQTNFDLDLVYSNAQSISTAEIGSTNELDLGSANMGQGEAVKLVINVTALTGTLIVKVCSKVTGTVASSDSIYTLPTIGSGATGQYHFTLPQNIKRYTKLYYTAGTSATITAWLTANISG